jgi:hypothetical protein
MSNHNTWWEHIDTLLFQGSQQFMTFCFHCFHVVDLDERLTNCLVTTFSLTQQEVEVRMFSWSGWIKVDKNWRCIYVNPSQPGFTWVQIVMTRFTRMQICGTQVHLDSLRHGFRVFFFGRINKNLTRFMCTCFLTKKITSRKLPVFISCRHSDYIHH